MRYRKWLLVALMVLAMFIGCRYVIQTIADVSTSQFYNRMLGEAEPITYTELMQLIEENKVDDIYYSQENDSCVVTLFNEASEKFRGSSDRYPYGVDDVRVAPYTAEENFRKNMLSYGINLYWVKQSNTGNTILLIVLNCIPFIALLFLMKKSMGMLNGIKDMETSAMIQTSDVAMSDIIGLEEITYDINCIIQLIKDPSKGLSVGAKVPHGILLSGPAGVGKTMIAKAISHEAGVPFISVNGSDFIELYVGNGARHVRQVFKTAREKAPCIIFIDEFDAIGERRDSLSAGGEDTRTINALLKEMDGFKPLDRVFVIAATNYAEKLDSSITRSGRFDREIKVMPPSDWRVRRKLFNKYTSDKKLAEDVDLDMLARTVSGFTGADINAVCNEAALIAMSNGKEIITHEYIEEAIDRKLFKGSYKKNPIESEDEKIVAYHEAGHAYMSHHLGLPISRASIRSTTSGVGGVVFHMDSDTKLETSTYIWNRVLVCYAGRAAEECRSGIATIGASNDITQATSLLKQYVSAYGFDKEAGMLDYAKLEGIESDDIVTRRCVELARTAYDECADIMQKNFSVVCKLAEQLLIKHAMTGEQIAEFFNEVEV